MPREPTDDPNPGAAGDGDRAFEIGTTIGIDDVKDSGCCGVRNALMWLPIVLDVEEPSASCDSASAAALRAESPTDRSAVAVAAVAHTVVVLLLAVVVGVMMMILG